MIRISQAQPRLLARSACAIALSLGLAISPAAALAASEDAAEAEATQLEELSSEAEVESPENAEPSGATEETATEVAGDATEEAVAAATEQEAPAGHVRTPYQPAEGAYIIAGAASNKVIDVVSGKVKVAGTGIQIYPSNNSPAQRWFVTEYEGHYIIKSATSNNVLQVKKTSEKQGTVTLAAQSGAQDQLWDFSQLDNGAFEIRSVSTGFVLDVKGGATANKSPIQVYRSNDTVAQQWSLSYQDAILDDGIYTIASSLNPKMVFDVPSGSLKDGTNIQLWTSNNSIAQKWSFTYDPQTGYYLITSVNSGLALAVDGAGYSQDRICQTALTGAAAQLWSVVDLGEGRMTLVSATAGRCIDLPSATAAKATKPELNNRAGSDSQTWVIAPTRLVTSGLYRLTTRLDTSKLIDVAHGSLEKTANLQVYGNNGSLAQKWVVNAESDEEITIKNAASGLYLCDNGSALQGTEDPANENGVWKAIDSPAGGITFVNVSTGKAIDVTGGKKTNGTIISVHRYNGTLAQTWRLDATTPISDGMYVLLNRASKSMALDVKSASKAKGAVVQLWGSNGTNAQKWQVKSLGGGLYSITNVNSGLVLDVKSGNVAAGTALQQWSSNGTVAQKWKVSIGDFGGIEFTSAGGDFCAGLAENTVTKGAAAVLAAPGEAPTSAWIYAATKRAEEAEPIIPEKDYVAPAGVTVSRAYQNEMISRANITGTSVAWDEKNKKYTSVLFETKAWNSLTPAEQELVQLRGSATDWYITVEKGDSSGYGTKVCVLHYNHGAWEVVRNFRANTASTFDGRFVINHKAQSYWLPGKNYYGTTYTQAQLMKINPYWMCYVHETGAYGGDYESGQGFHGGYSSKGCIAMPDGKASNGGLFGDAEWLYNNVPIHTTVDLF